MTPKAGQPLVITCRGGSSAARLAAEVARELGSRGVAVPAKEVPEAAAGTDAGRATVALDGCSSACSTRLAAARGVPLAAALNLVELGVGADDADSADPSALAVLVARRLQCEAPPPAPPRPYRHGPAKAPEQRQAHVVEDYVLALDALTSPVAECGALLTDAPTLASHVSDALGVSRAAAGEMLVKMEKGGLVRRGSRKELLLTAAGRAVGDAHARRLRLLEVFAVAYLGYGLAESHDRARRLLRGALDEEALVRLERLLGFPERCPHGWPLDAARARAESDALRALPALPMGAPARVARLAEDDSASLSRLAEHGILPGVELVLIAATPRGCRVETEGRGVTLDEPASRAVLVRPL